MTNTKEIKKTEDKEIKDMMDELLSQTQEMAAMAYFWLDKDGNGRIGFVGVRSQKTSLALRGGLMEAVDFIKEQS